VSAGTAGVFPRALGAEASAGRRSGGCGFRITPLVLFSIKTVRFTLSVTTALTFHLARLARVLGSGLAADTSVCCRLVLLEHVQDSGIRATNQNNRKKRLGRENHFELQLLCKKETKK
jgi:hypothetical protein